MFERSTMQRWGVLSNSYNDINNFFTTMSIFSKGYQILYAMVVSLHKYFLGAAARLLLYITYAATKAIWKIINTVTAVPIRGPWMVSAKQGISKIPLTVSRVTRPKMPIRNIVNRGGYTILQSVR